MQFYAFKNATAKTRNCHIDLGGRGAFQTA